MITECFITQFPPHEGHSGEESPPCFKQDCLKPDFHEVPVAKPAERVKRLVIDFHVDGQAQAMHNDEMDLGLLGDKSIARASDIRFNETTQQWDLWLMRPGQQQWLCAEAHNFLTYETARAIEVQWLNDCRLHEIDPISSEGSQLLRTLRLQGED